MFKKRIFKYIQSFGVINGIALFFKVRRSRKHGIIQYNTHNWAFEIIETTDTVDAIEVITIDEILKNYDFPRIDFLKIDIEVQKRRFLRQTICG